MFVGGQHIGDCDATWELHKEGKLFPMLTEAGVDAKLESKRINRSVSDDTVKPASASTSSDEEEDFTALVPVGSEPTKLSTQLRNEQFKKVSMAAPLDDNNIKEHDRTITELTKELDMFLQCIEEVGGFRDACIVNQQSSVNELEREIGILSNRCRMWKSTMDERLQEVQHLFDLTVQVLARKIYMEGIVKQAADSRYWDFCNFQKLSSELELKRRHIIKVNQELTDQLIELDRHFNALELNKFGGNERAHAGRTDQ